MVDVIDPDTDLLVRTIYGEGAGEPLESQQAIAATLLNRANTNFENRGASIREQALSPGQFQAWDNHDLVKRMHSLRTDDPAYQSILSAVKPVKEGQVSLPYLYYLNRDTTPPGSTALTTWAKNPGIKLGAHEYYSPEATGHGYDPDLAAAMGDGGTPTDNGGGYGDSELERAMSGAVGPDEGIVNLDTNKPIGKSAQQETLRRYQALGDLTTDAKTGQSFFKNAPIYAPNSEDEITRVPKGSYYVGPEGELQFKGEKTDDALGSVGQGAIDVIQNINHLLPGNKDSDLEQRLQVIQDQYDATKAHTAINDTSRFLGQVVPTTLALGGAAGLGSKLAGVAPKLAPALEFLGGGAGKEALTAAGTKVAGNSLLRGASLAANGALQGGVSNVLMDPNSNESVGDKFKTGAIVGAIANPVINKVGSSIVNAAAPTTTRFVNELTKDLDKFGLLEGKGAIRATQIQGTDANLPQGRVPVTAAEKAADKDQHLIDSGAFGYRDNATAQPQRLMEAVGSTIGLTPDQMPNGFASTITMPNGTTKNVMAYAQDKIGATINDVRSRQLVEGKELKQLITNLAQEVLNAKDNGATPAGIRRLADTIVNLKNTTRHSGKLTGEQLQTLVNTGGDLNKLLEHSDPAIGRAAIAMRKVAEKAMSAGSTPEDAAALKEAQLQYKAWSTLRDLTKKNPGGNFLMSELQGAVNNNFDYNPHYSNSPLQTLANIGQRLPNLDTGPVKGSNTKRILGHTALGAAIGELGLYGLGALNLGSGAGALFAGAAAGGLAGRKVANTLGGAISDNSFLRQQLLQNKGYVPNALTKFATSNLPVPTVTSLTQNLRPTKTMKQNNEFLKDPLKRQEKK